MAGLIRLLAWLAAVVAVPALATDAPAVKQHAGQGATQPDPMRAVPALIAAAEAIDEGDPDAGAKAARLYRRALELIDPAVSRSIAVRLYLGLGQAELRSRDFRGAQRSLQRGLRLASEMEDSASVSMLRYKLAKLAQAQGRWAQALSQLDSAANDADKPWSLKLLLTRADVLSLAGGRERECVDALSQAQALVSQLGVPERETEFREAASLIYARLGRHQEALQYTRQLREAEKRKVEVANDRLVKDLNQRFAVRQKEGENEVLKAQQAESQAQRRVLYMVLLLAVAAVFGAGVALVSRQRNKRRVAEEANLAKSRFLAAASHDLRQPVHALNLYLGTLAGLELPAQARQVLGNARRCGESMDEMFRSLLEMSRLDAAALQVEVEDFALEPVLRRLGERFELQARAKGLKLKVRATQAWVRSDEKLVQKVMDSLVSNALRYTERGGVVVGCRRRPDGQIRLAVYDTGPGIEEGKRKAIFEGFYQLGSDTEPGQGLRLGLPIVSRLAGLLGVPVVLQSRPAMGSMFAIDLPLVSSEAARASAAAASDAAPPDLVDPDAIRGALVVVIDDDEAIRTAMRVLLTQWGCEVVAVGDGEESQAVLGCYRRVPDLLICDYWLRGGQTGIDVVRALRTEFNSDIAALFVTGDTSPDRLNEIAASGVPVLHKPLASEELRRTIERLVAPAVA